MTPGAESGLLWRGQECSIFKASVSSRKASRTNKLVVCALTDRGRSVKASDIQVKSPLGQGSYGEVFEVNLYFGCSNMSKFPTLSSRPLPHVDLYCGWCAKHEVIQVQPRKTTPCLWKYNPCGIGSQQKPRSVLSCMCQHIFTAAKRVSCLGRGGLSTQTGGRGSSSSGSRTKWRCATRYSLLLNEATHLLPF